MHSFLPSRVVYVDVLLRQVGVGTGVKERPDHLSPPVDGGHVEGAPTERVPRVDPLSRREKSLDGGDVAALGRLQDLGRDGIGPLVRRIVQFVEERAR